MSKLPHVFSDASCSITTTTIAVYSPQLNIAHRATLHKKLDVNQAEELAFKLALKLTEGTKCHYFVDNQAIANKYKDLCYWIPRELNKSADALSKPDVVQPSTTAIATHIQQNYSLDKKLKLIAALRGLKCELKTLLADKTARRLMQSFLKKEEKPTQGKKLINDAKPIKQIELIQMIRTYQSGRIAKV